MLRVPTATAGLQPRRASPAAARPSNVPPHPAPAAARSQTGPPAAQAPATAATTWGPAARPTVCTTVSADWRFPDDAAAPKAQQIKISRFCSGEEAMDHQVSPEPENGHSEEEEEEASDLENGSKANATKLCSSPAKLFTFSVVNSYGTANISSLPCDGNILQLNREHSPCKTFTSGFVLWLTRSPTCWPSAAHSTVAIDWDMESKKLHYDEQEAEVSDGIPANSPLRLELSANICVNVMSRPTRSTRACCSRRRRKPRWP